jgi:hypothetical protein
MTPAFTFTIQVKIDDQSLTEVVHYQHFCVALYSWKSTRISCLPSHQQARQLATLYQTGKI